MGLAPRHRPQDPGGSGARAGRAHRVRPGRHEGACNKNGDRIDDTPAEFEPQFFCVERDSCTGKKFPGSDPIHNFMDYVDDACMDQFTGDQHERMRKQWDIYRARG